MLAHWYGLLLLGDAPPPKQPDVWKQGGLSGLKAHFRKEETEEQKRLRREAQGIIQRLKTAEPAQAEALQDEAKQLAIELQKAITRLDNAALIYQSRLEEQHAQQQAAAYQLLLIEAQLQAEQLQQQVEEMDVCYIVFMLAAHV